MSTGAASSDSERPSDAWADEAALLDRVARGERAASRALVDRHLPPVTRFAYRMLGDAAEAEDVAQEAFLRLWRQVSRWQPRAKVATWLFRVATNLCIDRLRARRTRAEVSLPEPPEAPADGAALLEKHERARAVQQALAALPERQRLAIALVYYEGLRNYEAAEVMDVKVDALESLLARARRMLRKSLMAIHGVDQAAEPAQETG